MRAKKVDDADLTCIQCVLMCILCGANGRMWI